MVRVGQDIPFDVSHMRAIFYNPVAGMADEAVAELRKAVAPLLTKKDVDDSPVLRVFPELSEQPSQKMEQEVSRLKNFVSELEEERALLMEELSQCRRDAQSYRRTLHEVRTAIGRGRKSAGMSLSRAMEIWIGGLVLVDGRECRVQAAEAPFDQLPRKLVVLANIQDLETQSRTEYMLVADKEAERAYAINIESPEGRELYGLLGPMRHGTTHQLSRRLMRRLAASAVDFDLLPLAGRDQ